MDPLNIRRTRPAETNTKTPLRESASQTAGPYVHIGCLPNMVGVEGVFPNDLTSNQVSASGNSIRIVGQVFEGERIVCKDIMLEFWQADETGNYTNGLWRRAGTNLETGEFQIETVLPGPVADESGETLSPFINVWVTARGINIGLLTRIYFPEHSDQHDNDPHLQLVEASRRKTLIARQTEHENEYRFDVHLQGEDETVFFDT